MKYGAKKDANHKTIVAILAAHSIPIYDTSSLGGGFPDCVAWVADAWHLVEIKNPKTYYGKRGLNPNQKKWIEHWAGGPVYILRTDEEAHRFAKGEFSSIERVDSLGTSPKRKADPEDALRLLIGNIRVTPTGRLPKRPRTA
jgi:hypothetical protein